MTTTPGDSIWGRSTRVHRTLTQVVIPRERPSADILCANNHAREHHGVGTPPEHCATLQEKGQYANPPLLVQTHIPNDQLASQQVPRFSEGRPDVRSRPAKLQVLEEGGKSVVVAPLSSFSGKSGASFHAKSLMQLQPLARALLPPTIVQQLQEWAENRVPADCGPDWSKHTIQAAVARGPHASACQPEAVALLRTEIQYQVDAGFARIVPMAELMKDQPSQLKLSPVAVIPQRNRRARVILNLSASVHTPSSSKWGCKRK